MNITLCHVPASMSIIIHVSTMSAVTPSPPPYLTSVVSTMSAGKVGSSPPVKCSSAAWPWQAGEGQAISNKYMKMCPRGGY